MNHTVANNLASSGFFIFPSYSGGENVKTPIAGIKWREESSNDINKINYWWNIYPAAAPAMDIGKSGFVVIDADRHSDDCDGVDALFELFNFHNYNPSNVPFVFTPNNGIHYYFKQPVDKKITNRRGKLPKGVDVRGVGGYVLAPGAFLEDGRRYIPNLDISFAPELPEWIVEIIEAKPPKPSTALVPVLNISSKSEDNIDKYVKKALESEYNNVLNAVQGSRNNTLNEAAFSLGTLVGAGKLSFGDAESCLFSAAIHIGLNKIEAKKTINSGLSSGIKNPRDLNSIIHNNLYSEYIFTDDNSVEEFLENAREDAGVADSKIADVPLIPYPVGLVGELAKWITDTAITPQPNLSIGAALSIIATLTGRQFMTPLNGATHLYIINIAGTAQGKDHPQKMVTKILNNLDLSHLVGGGGFISMTAIINLIEKRPISVSVMDEFGDFLSRVMSKQSTTYEQAIPEIFRKLWSTNFDVFASPLWAGREPVEVYAPAFNILGSTTPLQLYSTLKNGALENGTLNRFLIFSPHAYVESIDDPLPIQMPLELKEKLRAIYTASGTLSLSSKECPSSEPMTIKIEWQDQQAKDFYADFRRSVNNIIKEDERRSYFLGRSAEMCLRIATIIAIGDNRRSVSINDVYMAQYLVELSTSIIESSANEYMSENKTEDQRNLVFYTIKRHSNGGIDHSKLLRSIRGLKGREINDILKTLIEAEEVICKIIETPKKRPKKFYFVNNKFL